MQNLVELLFCERIPLPQEGVYNLGDSLQLVAVELHFIHQEVVQLFLVQLEVLLVFLENLPELIH